MKCTACGFPIEPGDRFCGECGHPVEQPNEKVVYTPPVQEEKNDEVIPQSEPVINKREPIINQQDVITEEPHITKVDEPKEKSFTETEKVENSGATHMKSEPVRKEYPKIEIDTEKLANQSQQVAKESYGFVSSALKEHDNILSGEKKFSMGLLLGLIGAGILLIFIGTFINLPDVIEMSGQSKSTIAFKFAFGVLLLLAISIGATFGAIVLTVASKVDFHKFLSDYVLLNTVSIALIVVGFLLTWIDLRIAPSFLFILGITSIFISSVYLIARYAAHRPSRIASFYGVILYCVVVLIAYYFVFDFAIRDIQNAVMSTLQNFNLPFNL